MQHNVKQWISTGDRSAKLKPTIILKGGVTDHRINKSIYNLDAYMNGDIRNDGCRNCGENAENEGQRMEP